jgi:hypothetical protein
LDQKVDHLVDVGLDVITHEMGHVIGIGTVWTQKGKLVGANTSNPRFTGTNAKKEYGVLKGTGPAAVPVENIGGAGTKNSHWRESVFRNELMSGFIAAPNNPLSRMTVASLKDLGYVVNLKAAEPYALPNLLHLAESGLKGFSRSRSQRPAYRRGFQPPVNTLASHTPMPGSLPIADAGKAHCYFCL